MSVSAFSYQSLDNHNRPPTIDGLFKHDSVSATTLLHSRCRYPQSLATTRPASTCLVWDWNGSKVIWSSMSCFGSTPVFRGRGDFCIALPGATQRAACQIKGAFHSGAGHAKPNCIPFVAKKKGFNRWKSVPEWNGSFPFGINKKLLQNCAACSVRVPPGAASFLLQSDKIRWAYSHVTAAPSGADRKESV